MAMTFKVFDLIIGEQRPIIENFKNDTNKFLSRWENDDYMYIFGKEFDLENKYFWLSVQYDNINAYNENVIDKNFNIMKNPKTKDQRELRQQFFALYNFKTHILYLSDEGKKTIVKRYFNCVLQKEVCVKNIFKSIDEFIQHIKYIKSISFIQCDDLFKQDKDIYSAVNNVFGLDYPNSVYVKANYEKQKLTNEFGRIIKNVFQKNKSGNIKNVVVCGYDDNDFEERLSVQNFMQSVPIEVTPDENNQYDPKEVLIKLLEKLKG